jgi:hypothetical protein
LSSSLFSFEILKKINAITKVKKHIIAIAAVGWILFKRKGDRENEREQNIKSRTKIDQKRKIDSNHS